MYISIATRKMNLLKDSLQNIKLVQQNYVSLDVLFPLCKKSLDLDAEIYTL